MKKVVKDKIMNVRLNADELKKVNLFAKKKRMTKSQILRMSIEHIIR